MSETSPILFRKELSEYDFGKGHPFQGNRFLSFLWALEKYFDKEDYELIKARPISKKDLLLIADEEYIKFTKKFFNSRSSGESISDFSKYHSKDNLPGNDSGKLEKAARLIVGQAKKASDLVKNKHRIAISIGGGFHHAKPNYGEGFCLYNDVAFAAKYLLEARGTDRIMILDTDAHFGNGTYEYFSDNPEVYR